MLFRSIAVVLVTNGVMSEPAAMELLTCTDAANVDLKAFDTERYRRLGGSLDAVKANIASWVRGGVHVELTHLVVPGLVDPGEGFDAMTGWIASLSPSIPLHLSRCFPAWRHFAPPTDTELLYSLADRARGKLRHVHLGNVR